MDKINIPDADIQISVTLHFVKLFLHLNTCENLKIAVTLRHGRHIIIVFSIHHSNFARNTERLRYPSWDVDLRSHVNFLCLHFFLPSQIHRHMCLPRSRIKLESSDSSATSENHEFVFLVFGSHELHIGHNYVLLALKAETKELRLLVFRGIEGKDFDWAVCVTTFGGFILAADSVATSSSRNGWVGGRERRLLRKRGNH